MKKWYWFLGIVVAAIAAIATKKVLEQSKLSAEETLEFTKRAFSAKGHVQGAWISATPELYAYEGQEYEVYKGGISILEDDRETTYQFTADSETGALLEYV